MAWNKQGKEIWCLENGVSAHSHGQGNVHKLHIFPDMLKRATSLRFMRILGGGGGGDGNVVSSWGQRKSYDIIRMITSKPTAIGFQYGAEAP